MATGRAKTSGRRKAVAAVDLDCATAFQKISRNCVAGIATHHESACAGDAEAVHQIRVAITRLRAAVSFFAPIAADEEWLRLKREIAWLNVWLGAARDSDVMTEYSGRSRYRAWADLAIGTELGRRRAQDHRRPRPAPDQGAVGLDRAGAVASALESGGPPWRRRIAASLLRTRTQSPARALDPQGKVPFEVERRAPPSPPDQGQALPLYAGSVDGCRRSARRIRSSQAARCGEATAAHARGFARPKTVRGTVAIGRRAPPAALSPPARQAQTCRSSGLARAEAGRCVLTPDVTGAGGWV